MEGAYKKPEELIAFCQKHVAERAAHPKHIKIMDELPKTAVGKIFKPDLRKDAIIRIYDEAFEKAGNPARVASVIDDKKRGLVAQIAMNGADDVDVDGIVGGFTRPWEKAA
mgnify:FL=1